MMAAYNRPSEGGALRRAIDDGRPERSSLGPGDRSTSDGATFSIATSDNGFLDYCVTKSATRPPAQAVETARKRAGVAAPTL